MQLSERDIQTVAVRALRKLGFSVNVSSNRRHTANTEGLPDLHVHIRGALWLAIEVKCKGGKLQPRQSELAKSGKILVLDSVESIIQAVLSQVKS